MSEFININPEPHVKSHQGNAVNFGVPVSYVEAKTNHKPDYGRDMLDYGNPAYNQIDARKNAYLLSKLSNNLDSEGKIVLYNLLKTGKLFARDAYDGSSTLENLYRIINEPRLTFLDPKDIVKETIKTLADPYIITQNFGYIPESITAGTDFVNFAKGHTCPAASIEFDLADRKPAEFVRYIEGLTSPQRSVKTEIKYSDLLPDRLEAMKVMIEQKTDFKFLGWDSAEVTIRPDENAYLRAKIQEDYRVPNSRSMIDVLMQSAFMELGSRGTYDSLTDERSRDTGDGRGLNQFEIAFVESIVDGESQKVPIVYMELDDEATKILRYTFSPETTKKHLTDALDKGHNIITGFLTNIDDYGNVITPDGHEIMLTGYEYDRSGKLWFKYNDTDDGDYFAPSWLEADKFIPTIHHANVPVSVLNEGLA